MLALLAVLIVVLLLAVLGGDIASPGNWHKSFKVHLGLDLTSGTAITLQAVAPQGHKVTQSAMTTAIQIMDARVNGAGITEAQVQQQGADLINVSVPGQSAQKVVNLVSRTAELQFRQVLLEASNTPVAAPTPTPTPSASSSPASTASPSASVSPSASPSSSGKAAGLPGTGAGAAQEMAARVRSIPAARNSSSASPTPSASASASSSSSSPSPSPTSTSKTSTVAQATGNAALVNAQTKALFNKLDCAAKDWKQTVGYTNQQYDIAGDQIVSCEKVNGQWVKYVLDKAKVLGSMVTSASAQPQQGATDWQVLVNFNGAGTSAFGTLTTDMHNKYYNDSTHSATSVLDQLAVVLDGNVISAPDIIAAIVGGSASITGGFDQSSSSQLANQLSYGKLPLSFKQQSIQSVSPQLGRDQLDAGLIAAGIGLILVVLYLLFYYRGLAIIATSSLVIAAAIAYESVVVLGKYQNFALNLAGIAGLIVAIGITADSFVVFFERLRDEVREGGKSLRSAVERGWARARRTILVSDTVSFLAAALLYYFAIGEVRGFAFTLGLTTIIDVIVVFTFTKPMMTLFARTKFFGGGHPMSGLDPVRLGARTPWRGTSRPATARAPGTVRTSSPPRSARPGPAKEA
jgi:preprotein translocase subunit SecD